MDDEATEVAALVKLQSAVEEELAAREQEDPYPFVSNHEKGLRCFILERLANAEIDATILVKGMALVEKWIETGEAPKEKKKDHVKIVE